MEDQKTVIVAVDGSEHSKKAFDCRWRKLHFTKPIVCMIFRTTVMHCVVWETFFLLCHAKQTRHFFFFKEQVEQPSKLVRFIFQLRADLKGDHASDKASSNAKLLKRETQTTYTHIFIYNQNSYLHLSRPTGSKG